MHFGGGKGIIPVASTPPPPLGSTLSSLSDYSRMQPSWLGTPAVSPSRLRFWPPGLELHLGGMQLLHPRGLRLCGGVQLGLVLRELQSRGLRLGMWYARVCSQREPPGDVSVIVRARTSILTSHDPPPPLPQPPSLSALFFLSSTGNLAIAANSAFFPLL